MRSKKENNEIRVDEKSPEFLSFKNLFKNKKSKDGKSFYYSSTSSSIADETIAEPPHYQLTLMLFEDLSSSKFLEIAKEIYNKANVDMCEIPDYYDTHYPEYTFEISFIELYKIYLKHIVKNNV